MSDIEIQFFGDDMKIPMDLGELVDDTTEIRYIETPENWKCPRENCTSDFLHSHGTYEALKRTDR